MVVVGKILIISSKKYKLCRGINLIDYCKSSLFFSYFPQLYDDYFNNKIKDYVIWQLVNYNIYILSFYSFFNRLYERLKKKKYRYKKLLREFLFRYNNCYFITLTFNDLKVDKGYNYIKYFLNLLRVKNISYICNEDFGGQFGRLHFHMICDEDCSKYWKYGFTYVERIKNKVDSIDKLTTYINKFTNHAFKLTNKRQVVYRKLF